MVATIDQLLPVAAHRAKRDSLVAGHFPANPPSGFEGGYTGITDTAGFAVRTVTSADALATEMNNAGTSSRLVLECAWNGVSQSGQRMFGYPASTLSANPAVDWGYDRPAGAVVIRPAAGYAPVYQSTYSGGVIEMLGFSKLHIENMTFEASAMKFGENVNYPCLGMVALLNNTFRNSADSASGAVNIRGLRTMHAAGNIFDSCDAGFIGGANYFRSWDNSFHSIADNDVHGMRQFDRPYQSGWTAHVWVAGAIVYNTSARKATSGLHPDFLQMGHLSDGHAAYRILGEMNVFHLDRGGSMQGTQGFFGAVAAGVDGDWLVHNNIGMISAYHAASVHDPNDNMAKVVTRNLFLRAATPNATQDSYPWIEGSRIASGTGTLEVVGNYAAAYNSGNVSGESFSGNATVDPRTSAASPNRYADVIAGNGTFGTDPATGSLTFASPDAGAASAAAARAAIAAFARPLAGWGVTAGPEDPATWPSGDYATLGAGGTGGGGAAPYTLPGPTLTINVQVV